MARKKMVLRVQMNCQKCRTKALKVVAKAEGAGLRYLGIEGEDKEKVVIIGDVDPVDLALCLRKKVGPAHILSVAPDAK